MRSSSIGFIEIILLASGLIFSLSSGIMLWNERYLTEFLIVNAYGAKEIGSVRTMTNDARRRISSELTWMPIGSDQKLFERDSIFTGNDSTVLLEAFSSDLIEIQQNTLIVISRSQDSLVLDLQIGSIKIVPSNKSNTKIRLLDLGKIIELGQFKSSKSFEVIRDKNLPLKVIDAQLNDLLVSPKEEIEIQTNQPEVKPRNIEVALQNNSIQEAQLKPKPSSEVALAQPKDQLLKAQDSAPPSLPLPTNSLEPVTKKLPKTEMKPESRPPPPALMSPLDNVNLVSIDKDVQSPMIFLWKGLKKEGPFLFQISNDENFSKVIIEKNVTRDTLIFLERLDSQKYFWRVQEVGEKINSQWSIPRSFVISK